MFLPFGAFVKTNEIVVDYKYDRLTKNHRKNNEEYDKCCSEIERSSLRLYDQIMIIKSKIPDDVINRLNSLYNSMKSNEERYMNASSVMESERYRAISNNILGELCRIESMIPSYVNDAKLYNSTRDLYYDLDCLINEKFNEYDKWYMD